MSRRIDGLKKTIKNNIAAREIGFLDTIPSIRDLTLLLGESRHVVNAALKELEEEKVLVCQPQKGFRINPALNHNSNVPAPVSAVETVEVIFTENLRWQTAHWTKMVKVFEKNNPGYKVMPRFLSNTEKAEEFINAGHGKPIVIVRTPPELFNGANHFIPVAEIERVLGEPLLAGAEMMPGLDRLLRNDAMPYILQPSMLLVRKNNQSDIPALGSWGSLIEWCHEQYGERCVVPINTHLLLQRIGLWQKELLDETQLRSRLELVAGLMGLVRKYNLYYVDLLREDSFSQMRRILDGSVRVMNRNSFYFGAIAEQCREHNVEFYPLPLEENGFIDIPVCFAAIAGTACSQGAAKFFQFVLGRENQTAILAQFLGISPFRCWNQPVLDNPGKYPVNLNMVIRQILEVPEDKIIYEHRQFSELQDYINCLVTDKLILPLLAGEITGEADEQQAIDRISHAISEKTNEIKQIQYVKSLRQQLLG